MAHWQHSMLSNPLKASVTAGAESKVSSTSPSSMRWPLSLTSREMQIHSKFQNSLARGGIWCEVWFKSGFWFCLWLHSSHGAWLSSRPTNSRRLSCGQSSSKQSCEHEMQQKHLKATHHRMVIFSKSEAISISAYLSLSLCAWQYLPTSPVR